MTAPIFRVLVQVTKYSIVILLIIASAPSANAQDGMLRGFVRDADDGEPMSGVNVVLTNDAGAFLGASSNFDGLYVIPSIEAGTYYLRASFIGYQPVLDTLTFANEEIRSLNLELAFETTDLDELVVETDREGAGAAAVVAGLQTIRPEDIDIIPSPDVSGDLASY